MKLLILLNSLRVSGTEKLMIELARRFEAHGDVVYLLPLITPFDQNFKKSLLQDKRPLKIIFPNYIEQFDKLIWKLNGLTTRLFNWSIRSFLLRQYAVEICKKETIDLIISNSYTTDLFVFDIWKQTGIRYIIIDHGSYCGFLAEGIPFTKLPIQNASALIGVSRWVVTQLKTILPGSPYRLVYNGHVPLLRGMDSSFREALSMPDYFVYCMHGRGAEQKGWEIAIKAFKIVQAKGFKVKLLMLTEGEYIDRLKQVYGNNPDLIFGKFMYNLADVFDFVHAGLILSQRFEAFGLTVLDYFSMGIPVVASDLGGISEVVVTKSLAGGFLVEVDGDGTPGIEKAAEKMITLIEDKKKYQLLSANARSIASNFSIEKCAAEYMELFKSLN
jgi:glycosyltransferase involved in cell wall biosynthesis